VQIRYYMICSRFESLIASHLDPEAFGTYMAVGTKKLASGHVVFFEIDPGFAQLTDHFRVEDIDRRCAPHPDGSPKRSKYISVYRVMEFLPLPVYRALEARGEIRGGRFWKLNPADKTYELMTQLGEIEKITDNYVVKVDEEVAFLHLLRQQAAQQRDHGIDQPDDRRKDRPEGTQGGPDHEQDDQHDGRGDRS
jgi:hypothetical protein